MNGHFSIDSLTREAYKLQGSSSLLHQYEKYPIGDFLIITNKNLSLIFFIEDHKVKESVYNSIKSEPFVLGGLERRSGEYLDILRKLIELDQFDIVDLLLEI